MQYSLRTTMLILTFLCVSCGFFENVSRHWMLLGEMTSNYTRIETHAYWIGLQGAISGFALCTAAYLLLRLVTIPFRASVSPPR